MQTRRYLKKPARAANAAIHPHHLFGLLGIGLLWLGLAQPARAQASATQTPRYEILQNNRAEDPVRFNVLQWNTALMSGQVDVDAREYLVAQKIYDEAHRWDIITLNEVMFDDGRDALIDRLAINGPFPYYTKKLDEDDWEGDGMVYIFSRWPILNQETQGEYGEDRVFETEYDNSSSLQSQYSKCCQDEGGSAVGFVDDCAANKGVMYAKIQHPLGPRIHVFASHTQADYGVVDENADVRRCQLDVIGSFIDQRIPLAPDGKINDYVVLTGDLNFGPNAAQRDILGIPELLATYSEADYFAALGFRPGSLESHPSCRRTYSACASSYPTNRGPDPDGFLDWITYRTGYRAPRNISTSILRMRGSFDGSSAQRDLSDHQPVLGEFNADVSKAREAYFLLNQTTSSWSQIDVRFDTQSIGAPHSYDHMRVLTGDFDNDGKTDIMKVDVGSGNTAQRYGVWVRLSRGGNWSDWVSAADRPYTNRYTQLLTADVNGDGRSDLIFQQINAGCALDTSYPQPREPGCDTNLAVALANPSCASSGTSTANCSFGKWINWTTPFPWNSNTNTRILVGDFNNDGKADIAKVSTANGQATTGYSIKVGLSNFSSSSAGPYFGAGYFATTEWGKSWWSSSHHEYLTGDFTGDGRTDIVRIDRPASGVSCSTAVHTFISTGSNFYWPTTGYTLCAGGAEKTRFLVGNLKDNASDARDDILVVNVDSDQPTYKSITALMSSGNGLFSSDRLQLGYPGLPANAIRSARCDKLFLGNFITDAPDYLELLLVPQPCAGWENQMLYTSNQPETAWAPRQMVLFHFSRGTHWWVVPHKVKKSGAGPLDVVTRRGDRILSGDFNGDGKTDLVRFDVP